MIIWFDERIPNKEEKFQHPQKQFGQCGFERMLFTIHPYVLPNEMPGNCSNSNDGLRMGVQQLGIADQGTDSLAKQGNYVHPAYQMDAIICLIRWTGVTQRCLRISTIPVPVLSGPTSRDTIEKEIIEWTHQVRRWTIGAAEVFHYFIIKARRMPFMAACSWGLCFIIYYGIPLYSDGLYAGVRVSNRYDHSEAAGGGRMYLFATHSIPFVLLAYSLVELYALHEIVTFGNKVSKQGASDKVGLSRFLLLFLCKYILNNRIFEECRRHFYI